MPRLLERLGLVTPRVSASNGYGVHANVAKLDRAGRFRPFGRDGYEVGDWFDLAHYIGVVPAKFFDPAEPLTETIERFAAAVRARGNRLQKKALGG